jgi:hypothetical protein
MKLDQLELFASEGEVPKSIRLNDNETAKVVPVADRYCSAVLEDGEILHFFRVVKIPGGADITYILATKNERSYCAADIQDKRFYLISPLDSRGFNFEIVALPLIPKADQYLALDYPGERIYHIDPSSQPSKVTSARLFEHRGAYYIMNDRQETFHIKSDDKTSVEFERVNLDREV